MPSKIRLAVFLLPEVNAKGSPMYWMFVPALDCVTDALPLSCNRFFMELNNRIFQMLSEVASSADPTLTAEHVRAMGLDPQGDQAFLVDLLEIYGIDAMLVIDNPCCH